MHNDCFHRMIDVSTKRHGQESTATHEVTWPTSDQANNTQLVYDWCNMIRSAMAFNTVYTIYDLEKRMVHYIMVYFMWKISCVVNAYFDDSISHHQIWLMLIIFFSARNARGWMQLEKHKNYFYKDSTLGNSSRYNSIVSSLNLHKLYPSYWPINHFLNRNTMQWNVVASQMQAVWPRWPGYPQSCLYQCNIY